MQHWRQKLASTLSLVGLSAFGYMAIGSHYASVPAVRLLPLETSFDALVPLVPAFVFAYLLYYPWLLLPLIALQRLQDFYRAIAAFTLLQLSASLAFFMYPSRMVRPGFVPEGLTGDLVRFVYQIDPGWNAFPSLHVGHSTLVALLCWRYRRSLFPIAAVGALLIASSTVLIKQHYLVDIPGGVLLAWVCFRAAELNPFAKGSPSGALALHYREPRERYSAPAGYRE